MNWRRSRVADVLDDMLYAVLDFMPILAFLAVCAALISGAVYGAVWMSAKGCHATGDKMGIEVEFSSWTGCMVRIKGTWLPWTEVVPVERDGKIVFEPKPVVRLKGH
jgi:hypothetical protein